MLGNGSEFANNWLYVFMKQRSGNEASNEWNFCSGDPLIERTLQGTGRAWATFWK